MNRNLKNEEVKKYITIGAVLIILYWALLYEKEHNHTKWLENMILSGIADGFFQ